MTRNLLCSLLIHALNGVLIWYLIGWSFNHIHYSDSLWVTSFYSVLGLGIYFALGLPFLRYLSAIKTIISLSFISIIGIILWISCYYFSDGGLAWFIYLVYNAPLYPVFLTFGLEPENTLLFTLLPSFLLWAAMATKHRKQKRRTL